MHCSVSVLALWCGHIQQQYDQMLEVLIIAATSLIYKLSKYPFYKILIRTETFNFALRQAD